VSATATPIHATPARARGGRRPALPAWALTAVLGLLYVILAPPSPDLAAASYRSYLFSHSGLTLWDDSWYAGHHLLAYSLLAPALGALVGPQLLAAVSMVVATALFTKVIEGRFPAHATRIASLWFAVGASIALLSSRVPFDLGLAIGLGAVLAAQRRATVLAGVLSVVCSAASPVAGAFLALAFLAWAVAGPARLRPAALAAAALAPIAVLALVFPEGGTQPFVASAFYPALAGVLAIGLLAPREQRVLRTGIFLYAAAMVASYAIPTAVGGNADRLGALLAGPIAACALVGADVTRWRRRILLVLAPLLLYWQANAPVADFASSIEDPATASAYYRPLLGELRALGVGYGARPARVEVVPTADHWEARWVAPAVMIARGWERQLDRYRNGLFYSSRAPGESEYGAWLQREGISYVALPDAPLDYSGKAEAALLRAMPSPYVHEVWRSPHWRLFAVAAPAPLVSPPAVLVGAGPDSFTVRAPRAGSYTALVHFTPYWALAAGHGCVSRAPGDWTRITTPAPGTLRVVIDFSLARVFSRGPRCR
jgi:hypothetical protein